MIKIIEVDKVVTYKSIFRDVNKLIVSTVHMWNLNFNGKYISKQNATN